MMSASSLMEASGFLASTARTTPGPETPTLISQSGSPGPWKAPAIKGLSSGALQSTTNFAAAMQSRSAVRSEHSRTIRPIRATASMLMPALVEPTFTEAQIFPVTDRASGMERMRGLPPGCPPPAGG